MYAPSLIPIPLTVCLEMHRNLRRVLPLYWVIHMYHRFAPLFWPFEYWTQSFWSQIPFLPRSLMVQFPMACGTPHWFSDRVPYPHPPTPGMETKCVLPPHTCPPLAENNKIGTKVQSKIGAKSPTGKHSSYPTLRRTTQVALQCAVPKQLQGDASITQQSSTCSLHCKS